MKKLIYITLAVVSIVLVASCSDNETYADQVKRERSAISKYIADSSVNVISETQFLAQDSTTDVGRNEWVLIENTGVYMQIVRKGCGERIKSGETATVLCRFSERNLITDSLQLSNTLVSSLDAWVDKMTVVNNSGTFQASFISGSSVMASVYGSTSVPQGWLAPLNFINVGRPQRAGDEIARVRIIIPHDQGHAYASQGVYPCLYDITYERGR